jgi:hypothetical protein
MLLILALLGANAVFSRVYAPVWTDVHDPGLPPSESLIRVATLGENVLAAYGLVLYLQDYDFQIGRGIPLASINYGSVRSWLDRAVDLDPQSGYAFLLGVHHYGDTGSDAQHRTMLDWVHRRFLESPDTRWEWLAHAAMISRHVLKDTELTKTFTASLREHVHDPAAPSWVTQMDLLLRADLGETQQAQILLGGLIAAGRITSPRELEFLESRLGLAPRAGQ